MVTEQLPKLIEEQVKAISNLKIDKVTVWDSGVGANGKSSTAGFLSGLAGSIPPLHELAKNAGVDLPAYMGKPTAASAAKQDRKPDLKATTVPFTVEPEA